MKKDTSEYQVRITRNKVPMYVNHLTIDGNGSPLRFELVATPYDAARYLIGEAKHVATMLNAWLGLNTCTDVVPAVDRRANRKDRRRPK